jgi:hypothetical protein
MVVRHQNVSPRGPVGLLNAESTKCRVPADGNISLFIFYFSVTTESGTERGPLWRYNLPSFEQIKMKARGRLPFTAGPKKIVHFPSPHRSVRQIECEPTKKDSIRNARNQHCPGWATARCTGSIDTASCWIANQLRRKPRRCWQRAD